MRANYGQSFGPPTVPGVKGPHGEAVPMAAPYNNAPPGSQWAAMKMMQNQIPMTHLQMHPNGMMTPPNMPPMPGMQPGIPGTMPGPGMMPGPGGMPGMMPGGMPGMMPGGNPFMKTGMMNMMPNSGVVNANLPPGVKAPAGCRAAQFTPPSNAAMFPQQRTQVFFPKPAGMKIHWFTQGPDGKPNYSTTRWKRRADTTSPRRRSIA